MPLFPTEPRMVRTLTPLALLLSTLCLIASCQCSRDDANDDEERASAVDTTAESGAAVDAEAADALSPEQRAEQYERRKSRCDQLVEQAWAAASSTLRMLGIDGYRELASDYRTAASELHDGCMALSDAKLGCVRSAQDVLFGLLNCDTTANPDDALQPVGSDETPSEPSGDGQADGNPADAVAGDARDDDAAIVVKAPIISDWVRAGLREKYQGSAALPTRLPTGKWASLEDREDVIIIDEDGTFVVGRRADGDEGEERLEDALEGLIELDEPGIVTVGLRGRVDRMSFYATSERLYTTGAPALVAVPAPAGEASVVDLGGDFVLFEQNERNECTAVHATGATLGSECRVVTNADGERSVVFRYRFPLSGGGDVNEHRFDWIDDVLVDTSSDQSRRIR